MILDFFDSLGVSQHQLQVYVVAGVIFCIIGVVLILYWKFIVAGAIAAFCMVVFASGHSKDVTPKDKGVVIEEIADDEAAFMEDCTNMTEYTKQQCRNIWFNREGEPNGSSDKI